MFGALEQLPSKNLFREKIPKSVFRSRHNVPFKSKRNVVIFMYLLMKTTVISFSKNMYKEGQLILGSVMKIVKG